MQKTDSYISYKNIMENIERISEYIASLSDDRIILLRRIDVIQWLFADLSFLPKISNKNKTQDTIEYKKLEDEWGQTVMKIRRPDLKLDKQWTNRFGEYLGEELCILQGHIINKPEKKDHMQPDLETTSAIIEIKAQTFYTTGTAAEKILGCPFKYAEIPNLYRKPLKILCLGGAEKICRDHFGILLGVKTTAQKQKFIDFYRDNNIEYISATDILLTLHQPIPN